MAESNVGVSVECMGCGGDITPKHRHTFAHCRACEDRLGFEPFERGEQVHVRDDWLDDPPEVAGCYGIVTGRYPTGNFEVMLRPEGWEGVDPFALPLEALETFVPWYERPEPEAAGTQTEPEGAESVTRERRQEGGKEG